MSVGNMKYCCVTGHRDIPSSKINFVKQELHKEIQSAIDSGYRFFISGFADGVDLLFAKIVVEYREKYQDIFLEAALPYPGWKSKSEDYNGLIEKCNGVGVHSKKYSPNCFLIRNRYMINACERIIAVYDGREKGGTVNTIRYAHSQEKEIQMIKLKKKNGDATANNGNHAPVSY